MVVYNKFWGRPMRGLTDKIAIVTGGASGLGRGMAKRLAAEGAKIVIFGSVLFPLYAGNLIISGKNLCSGNECKTNVFF